MHVAGWKVHLGGLPAGWKDGNELERWLRQRGVAAPAEITDALRILGEHWQAVLTFDEKDDPRHAKNALGGDRLSPSRRRLTVAKHFRPRIGNRGA